MVVAAAVGIAATISLHVTCKQYNPPTTYGVWLFPYVPALSVGLNCFLLGQLKTAAYERFGIWTAFVTRKWFHTWLAFRTWLAFTHSPKQQTQPNSSSSSSYKRFYHWRARPSKAAAAAASPAVCSSVSVDVLNSGCSRGICIECCPLHPPARVACRALRCPQGLVVPEALD